MKTTEWKEIAKPVACIAATVAIGIGMFFWVRYMQPTVEHGKPFPRGGYALYCGGALALLCVLVVLIPDKDDSLPLARWLRAVLNTKVAKLSDKTEQVLFEYLMLAATVVVMLRLFVYCMTDGYHYRAVTAPIWLTLVLGSTVYAVFTLIPGMRRLLGFILKSIKLGFIELAASLTYGVIFGGGTVASWFFVVYMVPSDMLPAAEGEKNLVQMAAVAFLSFVFCCVAFGVRAWMLTPSAEPKPVYGGTRDDPFPGARR